MRTVTLLHRTKGRSIKVTAGSAYRLPPRRPRRRPTVAQERLPRDAGTMLARSLTKPARRLAEDPEVAAEFLTALSLTAVGRARTIVREPDGSLSCLLFLSWERDGD